MSQNDLVIANQSFPATRADINSALQALGSLSSGAAAPSTTYANMLWYDTANNILKMRSEANDVWISVGYLNQSTDEFSLFDDTKVVNSSGTQTGIIGDQATSAWETGTSTTESLVSPAKVKAVINEYAVGVNQSWSDYKASRTSGTTYTNITERPIVVSVVVGFGNYTSDITMRVDDLVVQRFYNNPDSSSFYASVSAMVPAGSTYSITHNGSSVQSWAELR